MKKLAIREEPSDEEKYDFVTQVRLYSGDEGDRSRAQYVAVDQVDEKASLSMSGLVFSSFKSARLTWRGGVSVGPDGGQLNELVAAVLSAMSSAQKSEVKAWEEEIVPCSHTRDLVQPEPKQLEPSGTVLFPPENNEPENDEAADNPVGTARRSRFLRLSRLRPDLEPLAVSRLRGARVWAAAVRWRRWERSRTPAYD